MKTRYKIRDSYNGTAMAIAHPEFGRIFVMARTIKALGGIKAALGYEQPIKPELCHPATLTKRKARKTCKSVT